MRLDLHMLSAAALSGTFCGMDGALCRLQGVVRENVLSGVMIGEEVAGIVEIRLVESGIRVHFVPLGSGGSLDESLAENYVLLRIESS